MEVLASCLRVFEKVTYYASALSSTNSLSCLEITKKKILFSINYFYSLVLCIMANYSSNLTYLLLIYSQVGVRSNPETERFEDKSLGIVLIPLIPAPCDPNAASEAHKTFDIWDKTGNCLGDGHSVSKRASYFVWGNVALHPYSVFASSPQWASKVDRQDQTGFLACKVSCRDILRRAT